MNTHDISREDQLKIEIANQVLSIFETLISTPLFTIFLLICVPIIMGLGYLVIVEAAINLATYLYGVLATNWGAAK